MNEDTLIVIFAYAGDQYLVEKLLPYHFAHKCQMVMMSPEDAPARVACVFSQYAGKRGYIGQDSIDRHRAHLERLLAWPYKWFLLHDADSFCASPKISDRLYQESFNTVWSTEQAEPRPHSTPYPKLALQPPYFVMRETVQKILEAPVVPTHPITPYIDWWWIAHTWSAGVNHKPFTLIENRAGMVHLPGQDKLKAYQNWLEGR